MLRVWLYSRNAKPITPSRLLSLLACTYSGCSLRHFCIQIKNTPKIEQSIIGMLQLLFLVTVDSYRTLSPNLVSGGRCKFDVVVKSSGTCECSSKW